MRHVVVTGGGTGIGLAIAEDFARHGAAVTITGRRERVLREAAERLGARAVAFDASDPAAVTAALADLPESIDVLVNNAGGNTDFGPSTTDNQVAGRGNDHADNDLSAVARRWQDNLCANLLSAVLVTTAVLPRLADGARVINMGSIAGRRGSGSSYGSAKAALEPWTADLAAQLGPRGITANVISPGLVVDTEFFGDQLTDQRRQRLIAETRTGRAGTPQDVAALARFLAAPEAGHITGQVLHVNGGAHLGR